MDRRQAVRLDRTRTAQRVRDTVVAQLRTAPALGPAVPLPVRNAAGTRRGRQREPAAVGATVARTRAQTPACGSPPGPPPPLRVPHPAHRRCFGTADADGRP